ncbi:MAG: helix-turn-helix transcriptional regulator [Clostridiales bacterium]|nr:helix-turn-helix transcriptional regulator [Clostridiales bacterium]
MNNFNISKICTIKEYQTQETKWISNERQHHILGYQRSGFYLHHFADQSLMLKPDTFFFINQKDFYRVECTLSKGAALVVHFLSDDDIPFPSFAINATDYPHIKNDFLKLLNAWNSDAEEHYFYNYSLVYKLLDTMRQLQNKPYIPLKKKKIVEEVVGVLETAYREKIDFTVLASDFGFSPQYLSKLFREQYGMSPNRYLLQYRILKAMELLTTTALKIEEIAQNTGFNDEYYFSKFFKKQTGYTPTQFRKQYK